MYATCLHCHAALGDNAMLACFPVGRRLAYDVARGRLWAVCPACGRWNLAPLEERWEAVEACERLYERGRLRYGTDNVALARLADGTELVRIGRALRPELAAWRYGRELLRDAGPGRQAMLRAATALTVGAARARRWLLGHADGAGPVEARALGVLLGVSGPLHRAEQPLDVIRRDDAAGPLAANDRRVTVVRRRHLAAAVLARPDQGEPWRLDIAHEDGALHLTGPRGLRTAARLLAAVNRHGVSADVVQDAVRRMDEAMHPDDYFARVVRTAWRWQWGRAAVGTAAGMAALAAGGPSATAVAVAEADAVRALRGGSVDELTGHLAVQLTARAFWERGGIGSRDREPLLHVPLVHRLALEMVAHEHAEREALAGELAELERAWQEAEEIAAIADAL